MKWLLTLFIPVFVHAQAPEKYSIQLNQALVIQPTMWGLFFEDINHGADGGLYAQLVKNVAWTGATFTVLKGKPADLNNFQNPFAIIPVSSTVKIKGELIVDLAACSFTIINIKILP